MGLFDSLKNQAREAVRDTVQNMGNKTESIVFPVVPNTYEGFAALPQAAMRTPFETAAMTVVALCVYPHAPETSIQMLNFLRGPRLLNGQELSFIRDRFRTKDYVPRSYFSGATPQNDYTPQQPYTIRVMADHNSFLNPGFAKLFIPSGGADSPRPIQLRQAKDGKWYLWEQFLLTDIRQPESANPWA